MSWSYSGDPSASDLDMVRWLIGDTDERNQEQSDEEIAAALTMGSTVIGAAVLALDALIARYSHLVDYAWSGDYSESASQRVDQLRRRRTDLLSGTYSGVAPATADYEPATGSMHDPLFDIGMHDN